MYLRMCVCECKNVEGIKEFCKSKIDLKTFKAKKRSKIKFSKALIKRVGKRDNKNWPLFAEADFYDPIESSKLVYENSNAINFYFVLSREKNRISIQNYISVFISAKHLRIFFNNSLLAHWIRISEKKATALFKVTKNPGLIN